MKSLFSEPKKVSDFADTYGCFLMHCGALRNGTPDQGEAYYPTHGELPYADYSKAWLVAGEDGKGRFIAVKSLYEYSKAWADKYDATTMVKLYENSSLLDVSMTIKNKSNYPMELMYMCHPNFLLADGGRIVQSVGWGNENIKLMGKSPATPEFLERLKNETDLNKIKSLESNDDSLISLVFSLRQPNTDKKGWAHFMQVHPDGSADYVSYKPQDFDHCMRWMGRSKNEKVLGLALPATCETDGYAAEKEKGNIKHIPANGQVTFTVITGYLTPDETRQMDDKISKLSNDSVAR